MKPTIGQQVIVYTPPGRHGRKETVIESTVSKVGTKYFSLEGKRHQYAVEDWQIESRDNLRANFPEYVFLDRQAMEDWKEAVRLRDEVRGFFFDHKYERLTLAQLRVISGVIAEPAPERKEG